MTNVEIRETISVLTAVVAAHNDKIGLVESEAVKVANAKIVELIGKIRMDNPIKNV